MPHQAPQAIGRNHHEARGGEPEGGADAVGGNGVALEFGEEGAADDGHDQEGGAELGFLELEVFQGDAVDRREHQRHAGGDQHE